MKVFKFLLIIIPVLVFVVFVLGMIKWINKKSPVNNTSIEIITPTPSIYIVPIIHVRKTTSLLDQVNSFDPLETRFAPPIFEKIPELPKD